MEHKEKTMYDMELNESISRGLIRIRRVPGGWIYTTYNSHHMSTVFVPFDPEFQGSEKKKDLPY